MQGDYNYDYKEKKHDYNYDYDYRAMIMIMIMITDYSLAVTVYIGFLHSAANMQGLVSLITCSFMYYFINLHQ